MFGRKTAFLAVSITSAFSSIALAVPYLSVDFQGDTVGGAPGGTSYLADDANTRVEIVDGSSSPADPFGGVGNKSLLIEDDSSTLDGRVSYTGIGPGLTTGKASVDFFIVSDGSFVNSSADFRVGTGTLSSGAEIGPLISVDGTAIGIAQNAGAGGSITLDNVVTPNVKHTFEIFFDTATDTFTGTLDGAPLTDGGGTVTTFGFFNAQTEIVAIHVGNYWSGGVDSRTFYDNILLDVPEPASLALVGGLGMLAVARRRRAV